MRKSSTAVEQEVEDVSLAVMTTGGKKTSEITAAVILYIL